MMHAPYPLLNAAEAKYLANKERAIAEFEKQWAEMQNQSIPTPESQKMVLRAGFVLGWIACYTQQ